MSSRKILKIYQIIAHSFRIVISVSLFLIEFRWLQVPIKVIWNFWSWMDFWRFWLLEPYIFHLIGHSVYSNWFAMKIIYRFISFQIINGKYVEGFYIYARQLDSDNDTYKMLTILNGGGASTCTVTGLMKYQSYEFFIVPFYKTVEGKPSNSRVARTLEDGEFTLFGFLLELHKYFTLWEWW